MSNKKPKESMWSTLEDFVEACRNRSVDLVDIEACLKEHPEFAVTSSSSDGDDDDTASSPSALSAAVQSGRCDLVRLLLDHGAKINEDTNLPLLLACQSYTERFDIVKLLLQHGADVNVADEELFTPLMAACCNKHYRVAKLLLEGGGNNCNVNAENYDGCTPLLGACQDLFGDDEDDTNMLRLLLENGANPNVRRGCGCTAFSTATQSASLGQIQLLIDIGGADVNAGCRCDGTPLLIAFRNHNWDVAEVLLNAGANPKECFPLAIRHRQTDRAFLQRMLDLGADIDHVPKQQPESALTIAANRHKDVELVRFLLQNKANVNATTGDGSEYSPIQTPWIKFVQMPTNDSTEEIAKLFLEAGANVNFATSDQRTPLMLAQSVPVLKLLLAHPQLADVDTIKTKKDGDDVFLYHVREHCRRQTVGLDILRTLWNDTRIHLLGASNSGETVLSIASQCGKVELIQELVNILKTRQYTTEKIQAALTQALIQVVGPTCLDPVPPNHYMNGTMSIILPPANPTRGAVQQPTLQIKGDIRFSSEEIDENPTTNARRRFTSSSNFTLTRVLDEAEAAKPLERLEEWNGTFQLLNTYCTSGGGSTGNLENDVHMEFSKVHNADGPGITYNVKGKGTNSPLGTMRLEGTATVKPSTDATAVGGIQVTLDLVKTYQPGSANNRNTNKHQCDYVHRILTQQHKDGCIRQAPIELRRGVHRDFVVIAETLIQAGANINGRDSCGNTPLMIAVREHGDALTMIELLLRLGASLEVQNKKGQTPLFVAREHSNNLSTIFLLVLNGVGGLFHNPTFCKKKTQHETG